VILVTVGAQMPFDRMVRAVDCWAAAVKRTDVFAQIGPTTWRPRHIRWADFLSPTEFRAKVEAATLLVAHAGMGSILTALERGRPILVMPRRGDLMETRNDHQIATARRFAEQGRVSVAMDEDELVERLNQMHTLAAAPQISRFASAALLETVRSFVAGLSGPPSAPRTPEVVTRRVRLLPLEHHEHV
jgi:UDP-N-acetylglucosamine transferase subunit ALG13